jgi:hypothetical protein
VYATPPVVADLDGDGRGEVIFASWTRHGSKKKAYLYVLDDLGRVLRKTELPHSANADFSGALASPTLADVDGDGSLDVVLNTVDTGVVVFSLPGAATDRVLWGTGRGNYLRNAFVPDAPPLTSSVGRGAASRPRAGGRFLIPGALGARAYAVPGARAKLYDLGGKLLLELPVRQGRCAVPPSAGMRVLAWD